MSVRHTKPALSMHLPAQRPDEDSGTDESEYDEDENDDVQSRRGNVSDCDDLESSEAECSDSD